MYNRKSEYNISRVWKINGERCLEELKTVSTLNNALSNKIIRSAIIFYPKISYDLTNIFDNNEVSYI